MKQEDRKRKLESDEEDEEEDDQHAKYTRDDDADDRTANDMEELLATIEGDVCQCAYLFTCDINIYYLEYQYPVTSTYITLNINTFWILVICVRIIHQ